VLSVKKNKALVLKFINMVHRPLIPVLLLHNLSQIVKLAEFLNSRIKIDFGGAMHTMNSLICLEFLSCSRE
jgi:hypothetical protein